MAHRFAKTLIKDLHQAGALLRVLEAGIVHTDIARQPALAPGWCGAGYSCPSSGAAVRSQRSQASTFSRSLSRVTGLAR